MSLEDRISALSARADVLTVRVAKAAAAGPKRPRIPGDGDGDGIPNEGRNKKPGAAGAPAKHTAEQQSAIRSFSDNEDRNMGAAVRWANKEKDQYGTKWMRENLSDHLVERFGLPKDHAMKLVERYFPDDGSGVKVK